MVSSLPPRRIVLTTFGSLGDVHPYLALGLGLKARGHDVVVATSNYYREKITALGLGFHPVRPDAPDLEADPDLPRRMMDQRKGPENVIRGMVMPLLRDSYADLWPAADGADLLVSHVLTFATRLVAEKRNVAWASSLLQPIGFLSAYDPPVPPQVPSLAYLRFLGPTFHRLLFALGRPMIRSWVEPWHRFRADLGLPAIAGNPIFEAQHAPGLVLALFSKLLAAKQPDWPPQTVVTGFLFHDQDGPSAGLPPDLARFLDAGPPPIVFTLGSSAVMDAGEFYQHSARAAQLLGRRAVLLVGKEARNRPAELPPGVAAFDYAPYSELFPRAAALVHQGGVGTTAQAMRSGKPMLVMPYAHDQPDNAARMARLGVGRSISRFRYTPERAAAELRQLLDRPEYAQKAAAVGEQLRQEDGVRTACEAIEDLLRKGGGKGA